MMWALAGYSGVTWLVVANLAFSGLLVSWVMKFADSIVKVYATSMAMLLTAGAWAGRSVLVGLRSAARSVHAAWEAVWMQCARIAPPAFSPNNTPRLARRLQW